MIGKIISHYRILEKLGEGGMGVVYKAEDTKLKREVAIKFLPRHIAASAEERERFKIEAQAAAALNHANLATIYAIEEIDDDMFMVMEFIEGRELKQLVIANSQLSIDNCLAYATQIVEGLKAAHTKGIIHRDIKSSNIMVTESGQVKIMDFGLAKIGDVHLTKTGTTLGTAAYMSPEQARGEEIDHRTDIWSFGVVLYEMLAGQLPFRGEYEAAMMYSIVHEDPEPLARYRSDVPEALQMIVEKALQKEVSTRYQAAMEILADLKSLQKEKTGKTPEKPSTKSAVSTPERRQVTVMSCHLVASPLHSEPLDPEEFHVLLPAYQALCAKVIARYEGQIIQSFGDVLLVYFGYPHAHEDDDRRAVHAGLGILEGLRQMNLRFEREKGFKLFARAGIHTGVVVAGDKSEQGQALVGETPNLATQLQNLADFGALVISQATYRLVEGYFDCRDLDTQVIKGLAQPMLLYQVLYASAARSRLDAARVTGLTPLVGRAKEIGMLQERWEQVVEGNGQVVLLSGEAGIGKSRLVQELKEYVAANPKAWLTECFCSPYHQSSALYPFIELLERVVLQFEAEEAGPEKLRKLEGFLVQYGLGLPETVPLFATLLSIPLNENYPPLNLSPQQQKQKTLEALLALLLTRAGQQPLLFVMEDVHWSDPSTLDLLKMLIDQAPTTRLCILLTFRPTFTPPWEMRSYRTYLTLSRLSRMEIENMVGRVTKGKALPDEVLNHLARKTDGVPLFVEEMTKTVLESGLLKEKDGQYELRGSLMQLSIPATLLDSLMARLDRLDTAKEVAQVAAVLGREFPYEWLHAVSPLNEETLNEELARLVNAELLYRRGVLPKVNYIFKHALIQDAAYESLLKSTRQQHHRRFAEILATKFSEIAETQPELLAHHYTEAGLKKEAIEYWQKAGRRAIQRSANVEAMAHLNKGLQILKTLPDTRERSEQELTLQIALGNVLIATKGYASSEVEQTYSRARELCRQLGETPYFLPVLYGLCAVPIVNGEHRKALALGEELLSTARRQQDPAILVGHRTVAWPLFGLRKLDLALEHWKQIVALYDSRQHRSLAYSYGHDAGMLGRVGLAWTLWLLGYPEQALGQSQEGITLAREVSHANSLACGLNFAAMVRQHRRECQATHALAKETVALCAEQGFAFWLTFGNILHGWALAEQGQTKEGIAQMRQGLAAYQATGAASWRACHLSMLIEVHWKNNQTEEGLTVLAEALALVEKNDERFYEAELYRLKGELVKQKEKSKEQKEITEAEAEACFQHALKIAQRQNAKSLELRAAMSLGRLWQQQNKKTEARQLLSDVYNWFTEGFDTADLQEAKTQLEQWS